MDARRARILITSILSAGTIMSVFVTQAAAACALSAPATAAIGSQLTIEGSGFPASASVDVSLTIEGGSPDEFSVQSDANGAFQISLNPEAADAGVTTVVATSGADCTAQAVIAVGVSADTVTPEPSDGGAGAAAPPRTDAGEALPGSGPASPSLAWIVAGALFLLGVGGLYATRPARSR